MDENLTGELHFIEARTRKWTGASVIIHILVLLLIISVQRESSAQEGITEITWVELEAEPEPAPEPEPAVEISAPPVIRKAPVELASTMQIARKPKPVPVEQFKRELARADVAPRPQSEPTVEDVLSRQAESLDRDTPATSRVASLVPPKRLSKPSPTRPVTKPTKASSTLRRDTAKPSTKPSQLRRNPMQASTTVLAAVPVNNEPARRSTPQTTSATSTRQLAGAQMAGPVADRSLISYDSPAYPEWAKRDGVEASVTLRFYVLTNGSVKKNILVEKTSGFSDFDKNAIAALETWRFQPLPGASEQWGMITFHYRLSETN